MTDKFTYTAQILVFVSPLTEPPGNRLISSVNPLHEVFYGLFHRGGREYGEYRMEASYRPAME